MQKHKSNAFTLVELLVVVVILGILMAIGVVIYASTIKNAADARRKVEIITLGKNIEAYKLDHSHYPDTLQDLVSDNNDPLPVDPLNNATHYYFYQKFDAGQFGCKRPFYILGIKKFENSPKLLSWKCPDRDFSLEFDWAIGGYE